jgi:hypothetical protein
LSGYKRRFYLIQQQRVRKLAIEPVTGDDVLIQYEEPEIQTSGAISRLGRLRMILWGSSRLPELLAVAPKDYPKVAMSMLIATWETATKISATLFAVSYKRN